MKSNLISLVIAVVTGVGTLSASIIEHVQIGDLYYNLDLDARTAEVTYLNGNVYILTESKTYTITGTEVR